MKTRQEKVDALEKVPQKWREWVRFYLNDWQRKRKERRIAKQRVKL